MQEASENSDKESTYELPDGNITMKTGHRVRSCERIAGREVERLMKRLMKRGMPRSRHEGQDVPTLKRLLHAQFLGDETRLAYILF